MLDKSSVLFFLLMGMYDFVHVLQDVCYLKYDAFFTCEYNYINFGVHALTKHYFQFITVRDQCYTVFTVIPNDHF